MRDTRYNYWREDSQRSIDQYCHKNAGEDNADVHMKCQVMGREVVIAITDGALAFGPWEQIFTENSIAGAESVYS